MGEDERQGGRRVVIPLDNGMAADIVSAEFKVGDRVQYVSDGSVNGSFLYFGRAGVVTQEADGRGSLRVLLDGGVELYPPPSRLRKVDEDAFKPGDRVEYLDGEGACQSMIGKVGVVQEVGAHLGGHTRVKMDDGQVWTPYTRLLRKVKPSVQVLYGGEAHIKNGDVVLVTDDEGVERRFTVNDTFRPVDGFTALKLGPGNRSSSSQWFYVRDGDRVSVERAPAPPLTNAEKLAKAVETLTSIAGGAHYMASEEAQATLDAINEG